MLEYCTGAYLSSQRHVHSPRCWLQVSPNNGKIRLVDLPKFKLSADFPDSGLRLSGDHYAPCTSIQSMAGQWAPQRILCLGRCESVCERCHSNKYHTSTENGDYYASCTPLQSVAGDQAQQSNLCAGMIQNISANVNNIT